MKTKRNHSDFIGSQSGSMVMQVLIVAIMLTIVAGAVMGYISRQNSVHSSRRLLDEFDNFQTTVQMVLSYESSCRLNLVSSSLGQSPADLTSLTRQITLHLGTKTFSQGQTFNSILIKSIHYDKAPEKLPGPGTDYIAELAIEIQDSPYTPGANPPSAGIRKFTLPIYIGAKQPSPGPFTTCFATAYAEPPTLLNGGTHKMTAEDAVCKELQLHNQNDGEAIQFTQFPLPNPPAPIQNYIFKPSYRLCRPVP